MNRLSLFYDISGRIIRDSHHDKFIVVGGVIIPTKDECEARASVGYATPKWRDTNDQYVDSIIDVLKNYKIHCTVVKIEKTEPAWTEFWNKGDQQYQYLSKWTKPNPGFAKSANVLKNWAFTICLSNGLGQYLKFNRKPIILDPNGFSALCLKIVCDTDIQGEENREVFEDNFKHWSKVTNLTTRLGIKPYIECVDFKAEQEENLLMLPDYLAGYINYSSVPSRITRPKYLSKQAADNFGLALSTIVQFDLIEYSFDIQFPNLTQRSTGHLK